MNLQTITPGEFKLLRDYIALHSGIALGEDKSYLIDTRLSGLLTETGCPTFADLHRAAMDDTSQKIRNRMIDAMTTNETLWFRDVHPFAILREKLIPVLVAQLRAGRKSRIRIWSAASSTGQEPYSIAIAVRELCRTESGLRPENVEIIATDISPTVLQIAKAGRYDEASVGRGLPGDLRQRYFRKEGQSWLVDDEIKQMVTFQPFNLQDRPDTLGQFDIIFCRYVAIYFSDSFKRTLYEGFARSVGSGGFLLISAIENLRGVTPLFEPLEYAGGTYYRCL